MRVVGILLARMGSSRLPGKSITEIYGKSAIGHIIERMQAFEPLDEVVLATPYTPQDIPLQEDGAKYGAKIYKGSEEDVLDRLYQAAKAHRAEIIVHIGGDQPFADPALMQQALDILLEKDADYVHNFATQTYPSGQEQDVFRFSALELAWKNATLKTHRVNALSYFYHHEDDFNIESFSYPKIMAHHRWTLDYPEDLDFFKAVYSRLYPQKPIFTSEDIFALLEQEPELSSINAHLSSYTPDQPAYWDSEGYMGDMRSDLKQLIDRGIAADDAKDFRAAEREYKQARQILDELYRRAEKLAP